MKFLLVTTNHPWAGCTQCLTELAEIRKWITQILSKGFIRASSSSYASPILFVPQKDGPLCLHVDYRGLNDITLNDWYLLPCIEETFNQIRGDGRMGGAKLYT